MKTRKLLITGIILAMLPFMANAQKDISDLFKAGVTDLQTVAEGYIKPAGYGFAAGLGTNWYNTAATHKLFGFDLTIGASALWVPTSDQTFSLAGLQKLQATNGATTAPTFGGKGDGVELRLVENGNTVTSFQTPKGVTKIIPAANIQFTLGLPFGNDISVRFVPTVNPKHASVGLWGIGWKHDIKQWIPVVKLLPFDASFMLGYTQVNGKYAFDNPLEPSDLTSQPYEEETPGVSYADQGMKLKAKSFMANIIVSKKIAFFTPYVGVGLTSNTFDFNFTGNYPVLDGYNTSNNKLKVKTLVDPIPLHYSSVWPGATIGFRLKMLWIFALHAQYTIQKYSTASVGFGLNIR
jgi:hypothetical protein